MQMNWYAVYTKTNCEAKVVAQLNRKKIRSFCPLTTISNNQPNKRNWSDRLLFPSFVFVYVSEMSLEMVSNLNGIISLAYWIGKPAIIKDEEIKQIDFLTSNYTDVTCQRIKVNQQANVSFTVESNLNLEGSVVPEKISVLKLKLPSLGFLISTEVENTFTQNHINISGKKQLFTN